MNLRLLVALALAFNSLQKPKIKDFLESFSCQKKFVKEKFEVKIFVKNLLFSPKFVRAEKEHSERKQKQLLRSKVATLVFRTYH